MSETKLCERSRTQTFGTFPIVGITRASLDVTELQSGEGKDAGANGTMPSTGG
jgi:hypothetical protein